jgi:hypothetical protein
VNKPFVDSPDIMSAHVEAPAPAEAGREDSPISAQDETPEEEAAETEAEEGGEEGEPESTPEADAEEEPASGKPVKGVQKRIDELTRQRYETQRDRDYWREQALRGGARAEAPRGAEVPAPDLSQLGKPPTLAEHGYDEAKFMAALTAYNDNLVKKTVPAMVDQAVKRHQQSEVAQRQQAEATQIAEAFTGKEAEAATRYSDYEAVAHNPDLRITPAMATAIQLSEKGPDVAYHLGKNPAEAARIAGLNPIAQAAAIGRLEAKFLSKPQKKPTSAPDPVRPVGSKGVVQKKPEQMSNEEYRKFRAGQK